MKKRIFALFLVLLLFCGCAKEQELNQNLLENPGFESETGTDITGWQLDRYDSSEPIENYRAVAAKDAPQGENALVLTSNSYNDVRLTQKVPVKPDSYYCLSAMVKTGEITPRSAASGANISLLQSYFSSDFISGDTDWTKITVYGHSGKNMREATVCLRLGFYSADCKGEVYFDDVSFTRIEKNAIPEGASVLSMESFSFNADKTGNAKSPDQITGGAALRGVLYFAVLGVFAVLLLKKKWAEKMPKWVFAALLAAALIVRLVASLSYYGFTVDVNCFAAWGSKMASAGPAGFYAENYFCDYPPLYMFVLGILSAVASVFNVSLHEGAGLLLLKLPAVLCDILSALVLYKIIKKHAGRGTAVAAALLYAFNPAAILNSALWGQVDSVLVLWMLLAFYLVECDRFGPGVLVFFAGLLAKPQAVLFGPVMLFAAAREIYVIARAYQAGNKREGMRRLLWGLGSAFACVLVFLLLSVWMKNGQSLDWLWNKYMETIGSYNYATLNSFGFMGLLGGQWAPAENISVLGISYSLLGTLLVAAVLLYALGLFVYRLIKDKEAFSPRYFWLFAALIVTGAVTFSTRTHERYMFPAAAFLLAAFACFKDYRLLVLGGGFALCNFINTAGVLYLYEERGVYMAADSPVMILGSLAVVLLFIALAVVAADLTKNGVREKQEVPAEEVPEEAANTTKNQRRIHRLLRRRGSRLPKVKPRDFLLCGVITALYAALAFTNLGNTYSPQTYWYPENQTYYAVLDLGQEQPVDEIWFNAASGAGSFTLSYSADGQAYTNMATVRLRPNHKNTWTSAVSGEYSARYIKIETTAAGTALNELALLNDGALLSVENTDGWVSPVDVQTADAKNLIDCPESFTDELKNTTPETLWTSGEAYILTLREPADIGVIYGFIAEGDPYASVKLQAYSEETLEWVDFAVIPGGDTYAWVQANRVLSDEELSVDRLRLVSEGGQITLGELVLLDEGGRVFEIENICDEAGSVCAPEAAVYNCFDEPEKSAAYQELLDLFWNTASWKVTTCGDFVVADFGRTYPIDRGYFYTSVCSGNFSVYYSYDGVLWSAPEQHKVEAGHLYYWHGLPSDGNTYRSLQARYVAVVADTPYLRFLEMGFFESADAETVIPVQEVRCSKEGETCGCRLFDEQSFVPTRASYMNSMYFDEIYHARTAYESANGLPIYEWTHPPLGKDMMAWCVSAMGMTPFAWRFAGTMAGVLMLPAMYFFGLMLFKKRVWATALCALMALDGMHFVQTRIATIDSFGVLFIILMFLFMYWYYSISFYDKPLWKTFIPLGLCGLSFGLGAASKWIGLYAGAGLAVLFFITLFRRYGEYQAAKEALKQNPPERAYLEHIVNRFTLNTCYTLLFCILVFIIIPVVIYCASYYPYWNAAGESRPWYQIILDNQSAMFNYHSKLTATHPFQSDWYTWPVIYRPMFFYMGGELPDGRMECISSFGNPGIWYMGLVCTLISIGLFINKLVSNKPLAAPSEDSGFLRLFAAGDETFPDRSERDRRLLLFCLLGLACNLLPWVGISRCIFIYHYFASVPFIMIFTIYIFRNICRYNKKVGAGLLIGFLVLAAVLFFMFLPVWSGAEVSKSYVNTYLKWFSSWVFGS